MQNEVRAASPENTRWKFKANPAGNVEEEKMTSGVIPGIHFERGFDGLFGENDGEEIWGGRGPKPHKGKCGRHVRKNSRPKLS